MTKDQVDIGVLLKEYKDFEERSYKYFKDFKERIKNDRKFLSGEHYSEAEDKIFGKKRYKGVIDVTSNVIRSTVNQYSTNPYSWITANTNLNVIGSKYIQESNAKASIIQSLRNSTSYGLGYLVNTIVDNNDQLSYDMYSISDPLKVWWDPDSIAIDGSDASQCIIIDLKSKNWIKRTYGENILLTLDRNGKPEFDISEEYESDKLPLITYYVKQPNKTVIVYKILCAELIEDPIIMNIDRIPVVPVYGEEIVIDEKTTYRGIVSQTKPIQKLVNFAYSQLCERLSKTPKNAWITTKEAVENSEEYYKNFDKSINQLLLYNKYDSKKQLNEKPERVDCSMRFDDLTNIIASSLNLIQNITGVSSMGIPDDRVEITATEALLNAKTFATNIRNYFDNLKESFKACGSIFYQLLGYKVDVKVIDGPEDEMSRECARQQLTALLPTMTNETDKKSTIIALLNTYNGTNEYISNIQNALASNQQLPPEIQQQIAQMQQQLQMAEENAKAVLDENNKLQAELVALQNSNAASIQMKAMEIESSERIKMYELQLKYQMNSENNNTKIADTAIKTEADKEKEMLKADTEASKQIVDILTRG